MAIKEQKGSGGKGFLGYKTLLVNSAPTQILAYKNGLPPAGPFEKANAFEKPVDLSDEEIASSDLVRYNLGKFFYRYPPHSKDSPPSNYEFVEPSNNVAGYGFVSLQSGQTNAWWRTFDPTLKFQIGYANQGFDVVQKIDNFADLEFSSKTFVIISLNQDAPPGTSMFYLSNGLKEAYSQEASLDNWIKFLSQGKGATGLNADTGETGGISPQYLGLGLHKIDVVGDETGWYEDTSNMLNSPNYTYLDHAFIYPHPYGTNIRDDVGSVKVLFTNVESTYNFYQRRYEDALLAPSPSRDSGPLPTELYMPNFNVILAEGENSEAVDEIVFAKLKEDATYNVAKTDKNYLIHSTLNGRLPVNILRPLKQKHPIKLYGEVGEPIPNQYLDEWGTVFKPNSIDITTDKPLKDVARKFRNIVYPLDALKNSEINISKVTFPFYNEITFNTDTTNEMADILRSANLFDVLILNYISRVEKDSLEKIRFHPYQELEITSQRPEKIAQYFAKTGNQFLPISSEGSLYKTYDFDAFVKEVKDLNSSSPLLQGATVAQNVAISVSGEDFADQDIEFLQKDPLIQLIYKTTFLSLYADFIKKHCRTYKDIAEGAMAYSETLFYRIEKRNKGGVLIQSFYVLNDSQLDEVNLIDTQIYYGTDYTYAIFAVQLVVGNEYFYSHGPPAHRTIFDYPANTNPFSSGDELSFNFWAESKQSVKLIELPYAPPKKVQVQEAPPVPPDVNFVPYRNKDNQILITLNSGIDEYYDTYIPILPEDSEVIANNAIVNSKGQTYFKSEGDATSFEIFRISENQMPNGPSSYLDFGIPSLAKRITLSRDYGSPTFIDDILPNTKYWYVCRTNDAKHSVLDPTPDFSNPTNVFEVQIINNANAIYPIINVFDINFFNQQLNLRQKKTSKSMRKYLYLQATFDQTIINTDVDEGGTDYNNPAMLPSMKNYVEKNLNGHVNDFKLGYTEESVFGNTDNSTANKFKIRLISKKTGRKLDIYLQFKKPILEK